MAWKTIWSNKNFVALRDDRTKINEMVSQTGNGALTDKFLEVYTKAYDDQWISKVATSLITSTQAYQDLESKIQKAASDGHPIPNSLQQLKELSAKLAGGVTVAVQTQSSPAAVRCFAVNSNKAPNGKPVESIVFAYP